MHENSHPPSSAIDADPQAMIDQHGDSQPPPPSPPPKRTISEYAPGFKARPAIASSAEVEATKPNDVEQFDSELEHEISRASARLITAGFKVSIGGFLNEAAAAAWLGVSTRTLSRWRDSGDGPPYYPWARGKSIRYELAELIRWRWITRHAGSITSFDIRGQRPTSEDT